MTVQHASPSSVESHFLATYAARDWASAVEQLADHWTTLIFRQSTHWQVFDSIASAPEAELRRSPKTALMAEIQGRLPGGSTAVTLPPGDPRIHQALRDGTARDLVEIAALGIIARRAAGLPLEASEIARASRSLLRAAATTRFSAAADLAAYWHLQAGQAALHTGNLEQSVLDFKQAWAFRERDVTGYVATSTAPFLALLSTLLGDEAEAARWDAETDRLAVSGSSLIEWDSMERPRLVARLIDATDRLDLEVGREVAEVLVDQLAFDEIWPVTLYALVRHLVLDSEATRAEQLIDTTLAMHATAPRSDTMHAAFAVLSRTEVALAIGRGSAARRLLSGAGAGLLPGPTSVYAARVEVAAGDLPTARRVAVMAELQPNDQRTRREGGLLRTAIDLDAGDTDPPLTAYSPTLRRTAALLPPALNQQLRAAYGAEVPHRAAALAGVDGVTVKLTPSEERVLEALRSPGPLPEVAARLFISRNTLKTHLRSLYAKLQVSSREEAVAVASDLGLLGDDEGPPP